MSPDRLSCSTRCGSGVCGGGSGAGSGAAGFMAAATAPYAGGAVDSSTRVAVDVERLLLDGLLAVPLGDLAAFEHRRVVGLDRRLAVVVQRSLRPALLPAEPHGVIRSRGDRRGICRELSTTKQYVECRPDAQRDRVDRRTGDYQCAEDREQHQERRCDVLREQVGQERRHDVPDRAAGLLQAPGVRVSRPRDAVGDVHQAEHAEGDRRPADHLASGRAVAVRVTQGAEGDEQKHQRDGPAEHADAAADHGPYCVADRAGQLPPDRGGHDDGQADQGEAGTVAAVRRIEVPRAVADAADHAADQMRDPDPGLHEAAAEVDHRGRERTRSSGLGRAGTRSGAATALLRALPTLLGA